MIKRSLLKILALLCIFGGVAVCVFAYKYWFSSPPFSVFNDLKVEEYIRTLDKYTFQRLRDSMSTPTKISLEKVLEKKTNYTSYLFSYTVSGKKVTGVMNLPNGGGKFPVIVMIRGYVDKEIYYSGLGTKRGSEAFAEQGYITVAPDFLGYGGSDPESFDILEARFAKPQAVLQLLSSLEIFDQADMNRLGIWGHSNGGQIALSILEITQRNIPTTLWAPVSIGFPDSILAFTDELEDKGAYIKGQLATFDERYKEEDYSIADHFGDIAAPIQIHQGTADTEVKIEWTEKTISTLKTLGKSVTLFTYPGEDHNFTKGSFAKMMQRDLSFFQKELKK